MLVHREYEESIFLLGGLRFICEEVRETEAGFLGTSLEETAREAPHPQISVLLLLSTSSRPKCLLSWWSLSDWRSGKQASKQGKKTSTKKVNSWKGGKHIWQR